MAQKTLTTSYLARLSNANHDGVTQQIDDRFAAFETDNTMFLNAATVVHAALRDATARPQDRHGLLRDASAR